MQQSITGPAQRPACRLRQIVEANRETNRSRPDQFRRTRNWSTRCACRTPPTNTNPMLASDSPISAEGEQCGWFQNGQVSEILRRGEALGTHQGQTAALLQRCWRVGILREFGANGFRFSCWERIMPFKRPRRRALESHLACRNRGAPWFGDQAAPGSASQASVSTRRES